MMSIVVRRSRSMPVWLVISPTRLPRNTGGVLEARISTPDLTAGAMLRGACAQALTATNSAEQARTRIIGLVRGSERWHARTLAGSSCARDQQSPLARRAACNADSRDDHRRAAAAA